MFGENLRILAQAYPSVSELSRQLGINRTQFNRYLSGESFPRPDVLARICAFFDVDARVLLEPVASIMSGTDAINGPILKDFIGAGVKTVTESTFPSGFYRFSRRSFLDSNRFVVGLVWVFREGDATYVRGYEARAAMEAQGLGQGSSAREFRGLIIRHEDGVSAMISRKGAMTASFNFLSRITSFENNYWVGYVARTVRDLPDAERVVRMVYEHLGQDIGRAKAASKSGGYCGIEGLLPFHQRLLQPDAPFR
ncbi:helix-turn-helix transcriptional regulator [uncultured Tateyamaria sp.]|uniref:helix-turn-helix domain-containing protein n=1 Tax=uncultured Tateyamaria sp. TaxID=455651 RepID=UPI002619A0BD|nr:helix-turn-helix transcriptional regulator [uncultured Tateyamaria sp.]